MCSCNKPKGRNCIVLMQQPFFPEDLPLSDCRITCLLHETSLCQARLTFAAMLYHSQDQRATMPGPSRVQCITFGAPLLGDVKLQRYIGDQGWQGDFLQMVARHDIVPRMLVSKQKGGHLAVLYAARCPCRQGCTCSWACRCTDLTGKWQQWHQRATLIDITSSLASFAQRHHCCH